MSAYAVPTVVSNSNLANHYICFKSSILSQCPLQIDSQDWATGDRAFSSSMSQVAGTQEDRRMVVLAPEYCFAASSENPNPSCANSLLSPEGRSPILTCSQCMIAVHASKC